MLLPTTCPVCAAPGPAPCPACIRRLRPAPALPPPPGVDSCAALLAYEGAGRELVARLKYRNHRAALPALATAAAAMVDAGAVDVVTWAPTTAARRRQRGFDQAELLARAVARRLGRPCRRLLARAPGPAQTGRPAAERRRDRPRVVARRPAPARVLVVDDVITTGGTAAAAAAALRSAGARYVSVLSLARTPLKPTTQRDDI